MQRITIILFVFLLFVTLSSACSAQPTQVQPTSAPTTIIERVFTQTTVNLPQTEAEVPRVSVEEAKAAFESGAAVIVDVRNPSAFEASHVAGAISIPLGEIERNPTDIAVDESQWIITYCT